MPDAEYSEVATCLPNQENTSQGSVEFKAVVLTIEDKVNPDTENYSRAKKGGNYNHYLPEICAKISKYASEMAIPRQSNRNPQFEREHSLDLQAGLPEESKRGKKRGNEAAKVLSIPHNTRGWPSALRELDDKLISLLQSIRSQAGVVNFCFVKATALALVNSNPSANLSEFEATAPWARSIYRRCNFPC